MPSLGGGLKRDSALWGARRDSSTRAVAGHLFYKVGFNIAPLDWNLDQ